MANMTEFGKSPLLTVDELAELGYAAVLFPVTLLPRGDESHGSRCRLARRRRDADASLFDLMQTREELYDLLDYQGFEERDREHFGRSLPRPVLRRTVRASSAQSITDGPSPSPARKLNTPSAMKPHRTKPISPGLEGVIAGETAVSTLAARPELPRLRASKN